ncbi:DedA family protein [Spiractinospora alimapuensis]|uniref:DedA family protein n=1 Tax=Spiractinospora alimapuensis TaxID=2820884 RepID=UPI001F44A58D|nr:VTT domain-containing protein [Spiractinospora alimapuensis]
MGNRLDRAESLINRFGPPVVTVAYVTVGIQTAIHLAAGAMRMHFVRYLLAMIPGCAIWAAIYSLGGMYVVAVWWRTFLESPGLAVAVAVAALAGAGAWLYWRRRRDTHAADEPTTEREPAAS